MKANTTKNIENNATMTATRENPKHNAGTYHGKQIVTKYSCYIPGSNEKPHEIPADACVNAENKPESVKPEEKPVEVVKPENKPENKPKTKQKSPVESSASVPNKETNKPGIREKAREDIKAFRDIIARVTKKPGRGMIDYSDTMPGLYRVQCTINGKLKTVARVKAQRDVYVLVREAVAQDLKYDYLLINYNLPAGVHFTYSEIEKELERLCAYFETETETKTAKQKVAVCKTLDIIYMITLK